MTYPDETTDSIAKSEFGHLRDRLAIADDYETYAAEELNRL
jgi:hypothetical protein